MDGWSGSTVAERTDQRTRRSHSIEIEQRDREFG